MGKHDKKVQNGVTTVTVNKQGNSNDVNMAAVGGVSQHATQWSNMQYIQPQSNIQPHLQSQTNNTMSNNNNGSMLSIMSAQMQMGDVGQGANQIYSGQQSILGRAQRVTSTSHPCKITNRNHLCKFMKAVVTVTVQ